MDPDISGCPCGAYSQAKDTESISAVNFEEAVSALQPT